jgi:hypothetical protein
MEVAMLFYKDEEDYKKGIEENIEWNESWIKKLEGFPGTDSRDDAIKKHKGYIAHAKQIYAERYGNRYGKQNLTVIRGGKGIGTAVIV